MFGGFGRMMRRHQDPVLIVAQMVSLQCLYYAAQGAYFCGVHVLYGFPLSLERFFGTTQKLDLRSGAHALELGGVLVAGLCGAALLPVVVERARKCLDFSATLYGAHLCLCLAYSGLAWPRWTWWLAHAAALVAMVVLGEYLCSRRELREIPLVH